MTDEAKSPLRRGNQQCAGDRADLAQRRPESAGCG